MGGAANFDDDEGTISDINVTPLVDIVLVLLIVFMITIPQVVNNAPVKVDLPETTAYPSDGEPLPLNVFLKEEGEGRLGWYVDSTRTENEAAFKARLRDMKIDKDQPVSIAADREIPYENIVKVMDVLSQMGITKIWLPTTGKK
jgi:biopolymer transport protein ExbD